MFRKEAAKLLGVTEPAIAQWEREGKLKSKRIVVTDARGNVKVRIVLDDDEVIAFKAAYKPTNHNKHRVKRKDVLSGERASRAFAIFERCRYEGREEEGAWEAVRLVRITPDMAAELWQKWRQGVEGVLEAKRIQDVMKQSERQWKAQLEERRREEHRKHQVRLAELRKHAPAPIILSRIVSEAKPIAGPEPAAPAPKPAPDSIQETALDTGQTE